MTQHLTHLKRMEMAEKDPSLPFLAFCGKQLRHEDVDWARVSFWTAEHVANVEKQEIYCPECRARLRHHLALEILSP